MGGGEGESEENLESGESGIWNLRKGNLTKK